MIIKELLKKFLKNKLLMLVENCKSFLPFSQIPFSILVQLYIVFRSWREGKKHLQFSAISALTINFLDNSLMINSFNLYNILPQLIVEVTTSFLQLFQSVYLVTRAKIIMMSFDRMIWYIKLRGWRLKSREERRSRICVDTHRR